MYSTEDPFNDDLVGRFTIMLRQEVGLRLHATTPLLPMAWTRAPAVVVEGVERPGAGRHPCAPADGEGTHFAGVRGRMAFVQQVLHAVSLLARDRGEWAARPWSVARAASKEFQDNVCY